MSPCVVLTILATKNRGTWRLCTNSRIIDTITIRYRLSILRIGHPMDLLGGESFFTNFYLKSGYHQLRIKEGDERKPILKTTEGLYGWLVIPFGLTSSPSSFMRIINEVI